MAVALATAGLATGALGANVVAANAEAPTGDGATTTTSTTPAETTTTAPPTTTVPDTTTTEQPATTPQASPPPPAAPARPSTQTTRPSAVAPAAPSIPYYPPLPMAQPGAGGPASSSRCINAAADIRERAALRDLTVAEQRALSIARRLYVIRCAPDLDPPPAAKHTTGVTAADAPRGSTDGLDEATRTELRTAQGLPTLANPTMSLALPGAAPIGVPNFFIDKFRIPVFLLPIYQAAGIEYGVRWEVLAAINEIETDYGRNLNISSAGAMGWMQFLPETWATYGVDANGDGRKDPFNPVDAIFAAARYLKAAGADSDLRKAIFAYNHADWYVDSVLMRARLIGGLPSDLVGALSGLTQGRFPVYAKARYADDLAEQAAKRMAKGKAKRTKVTPPAESATTRRGIDIFAAPGSPVIAVADGRIVSVGKSKRLGNFVSLVDAYGNTYTYAHLKKVATKVPVPKERKPSAGALPEELELPKADPKPTVAATAGSATRRRPKPAAPAVKPSARRTARRRRPQTSPRRRLQSRRSGCSRILRARASCGSAARGSSPHRNPRWRRARPSGPTSREPPASTPTTSCSSG